METNKLLHMPTGLVGVRRISSGIAFIEINMGEARLSDYSVNFKPLSEFDKSDLRDGDFVEHRNEFSGYICSEEIQEAKSSFFNFLNHYSINLVMSSDHNFDIMKVTRNNEVIWEREEKSEVQQILESLSLIIKPSAFEEANELFRRLEAIEAKRSAE